MLLIIHRVTGVALILVTSDFLSHDPSTRSPSLLRLLSKPHAPHSFLLTEINKSGIRKGFLKAGVKCFCSRKSPRRNFNLKSHVNFLILFNLSWVYG